MITINRLSLFRLGQSVDTGSNVLFAVICSFVAFCTGVLIAFDNLLFILLLFGGLAALGLMAKPRISVWLAVVGGSVVAGLTELYLPSLQQVRWAVSLLSMMLTAQSLLIMLFYGMTEKTRSDGAVVKLFFSLLGFIVCTLLSIFVNIHNLASDLIGLKNYFQMLGIFFALYALRYSADELSGFMRYIVLLGFLQLPFIFHQFIVLVPLRSDEVAAAKHIVAVDIVAGTFGGSMTGGGRSPILALLETIAIVLAMAQWRSGFRTPFSTGVCILSFIIPMMLSEAKLFIVILPIGLFVLFRDRILINPVKAISAAAVVFCFIAVLMICYSLMPGASSQKTASLDSLLTEIEDYNVGNRGYGDYVLNRTTIYPFWWDENFGRGDYLGAFFGHGPGATNESSLVAEETLANTRYFGYGIGLTAASSLLWETGLLGTSSVFLLMGMAYRLGAGLEKRWRGTSHWPLIRTAQISMLLIGISIFHNNYFVSDGCFQTLQMLLMGYLAAMSRYFPESQT